MHLIKIDTYILTNDKNKKQIIEMLLFIAVSVKYVI